MVFSTITRVMVLASNALPASAEVTKVNASNRKNSFACEEAIPYLRKDIQGRLHGRIARVSTDEVSNSPYSVNTVITVYLEHGIGANGALMGSPALQKSYAKRIVDNCYPVVQVGFLVDQTDWSNTWSLHPTGNGDLLLQDRCPPEGQEGLFNHQWGYSYCYERCY